MRPTTYNQDVIDMAREYLVEYENEGEVIPTVVGLCKFIGRSKATIYNWIKDDDKKEFLDIVNEIEEYQHIKLVSGGLSGTYNNMITKLMLSKHGYSDKVEQDITSGGKALQHPGYTIVKK